ncbi:hypothetical protein D3C84_1044820 [compost metagenome]
MAGVVSDSGIVSAHAQVASNRLAITAPPCPMAVRENVFMDTTPCVFVMPRIALNPGAHSFSAEASVTMSTVGTADLLQLLRTIVGAARSA